MIRKGLVGLTAFMLLWMTFGPALISLDAAQLEAAEAEAHRECVAAQPLWAIGHRSQRAAECTAARVRDLRARKVTVPASVMHKHADFLGVRLTHHLGAATWMIAGLAQFGLPRDSLAARQRHRRVGFLYLISVLLLTIGFLQICWHDLLADRDFRAFFPHDFDVNY